MSLSNLASLGSFISGVAVVVTLVLLLLQMRRANRYQQASMHPAVELSAYYKMALREQLAQVRHPAIDFADPHSAQASFQEAMKPGPR